MNWICSPDEAADLRRAVNRKGRGQTETRSRRIERMEEPRRVQFKPTKAKKALRKKAPGRNLPPQSKMAPEIWPGAHLGLEARGFLKVISSMRAS